MPVPFFSPALCLCRTRVKRTCPVYCAGCSTCSACRSVAALALLSAGWSARRGTRVSGLGSHPREAHTCGGKRTCPVFYPVPFFAPAPCLRKTHLCVKRTCPVYCSVRRSTRANGLGSHPQGKRQGKRTCPVYRAASRERAVCERAVCERAVCERAVCERAVCGRTGAVVSESSAPVLRAPLWPGAARVPRRRGSRVSRRLLEENGSNRPLKKHLDASESRRSCPFAGPGTRVGFSAGAPTSSSQCPAKL